MILTQFSLGIISLGGTSTQLADPYCRGQNGIDPILRFDQIYSVAFYTLGEWCCTFSFNKLATFECRHITGYFFNLHNVGISNKVLPIGNEIWVLRSGNGFF